MILALVASGCVYSSENRAEDLANATATPARTPNPAADDGGGDDGGSPGASDDGQAVGEDDDTQDGEADAPEPTPGSQPGWVVVENVDVQLNVRAGPGTENPVIDQVDLGTTLATTGQQSLVGDTPWIEVVLEDENGWVHSGFVAPTAQPTPTPLATPTPLPTPTPALTGDELVVNAPDGLNLRTGPSSDADRIRTIDDGTLVIPTGRTDTDDDDVEWTEITADGDTGWVATEFLGSP